MHLAAIIRILGNDNPPRDNPGQRERVLRQILTTEPAFPDVTKWYVVNRPFDVSYRRQLCELLDQHDAHYITFGFDRRGTPPTDIGVRTQGIQLNATRNYGILAGLALARYAVILDGDCGFTTTGWAPVAAAMRQDTHQYLSIPHRRVGTDEQAEPMLAFRNDSTLRFDEQIPFGHGDKLELLFRLGHERTGRHLAIQGNTTRLVGEVLHYPTGDDLPEQSVTTRKQLRIDSMQALADRVRDWPRLELLVTGPHAECWKNVPGFFDFSGPYSGFAFDAPDNAHFVEVGSWQGKSVIHLATQLRAMGKRARIDAVDTWDGGRDQVLLDQIAALGGPAALYRAFCRHVEQAGLADKINPVRADSVTAAAQYADRSLDVVFLDGGHDYDQIRADLHAWYPKVKIGGVLAGHDFNFAHPLSRLGVIPAVCEFFANRPLEILPQARTWKHVKYGDEHPTQRQRRWA